MSSSILNKKLSVFIPFYNESQSLASTVTVVSSVLAEQCAEYEIILVDDGSYDGSELIARDLARSDASVRVVRLSQNSGFGKAYLAGLKSARYSHSLYLTADGDVHHDELKLILSSWDGRRSVLQYPTNPRSRRWYRYVLSSAFTVILNFLTGRREHYYNGFNIYSLDRISRLDRDFGFCTQAYALLYLTSPESEPIRIGTVSRYNDNESKALTLKNILLVFRFMGYILTHKP